MKRPLITFRIQNARIRFGVIVELHFCTARVLLLLLLLWLSSRTYFGSTVGLAVGETRDWSWRSVTSAMNMPPRNSTV
jgi:hypothetical protein